MPIPMTHLSVQVNKPVCRDSPPRSELSLLCVCPFTAVNALLQFFHYCNKLASSNTNTVILSQALYTATTLTAHACPTMLSILYIPFLNCVFTCGK